MRAPTPARLLLLALLCLAAAARGGSGDEPSTAAPATTAGAATTTAPASQACADAAALKASVAELDQIDPPEAGKAGVQAALEKVRTNLAALRTSAASDGAPRSASSTAPSTPSRRPCPGSTGNNLLSDLPTIVSDLERIDGAWTALEQRIDQDC